ncbi:MAG: hypothetical protein U1A27_08000 [Phycisphaerae bacterium]
MSGGNPAIDSLLFVVLVAPIAVYFLLLGLVNSHATPCLISSRSDFVALTVVFLPLLVAPMPALVGSGAAWLLVVEAGLVGWLFHQMLPGRRAGWVIYNISAARARAVVEQAAADAGWNGTWQDESWRGPAGTVRLTSLPVLRNVTVHLDPTTGTTDQTVAALERAISGRLGRIRQLPSTAGACLVMLGVSLLAVPIWMMGRHIQDVVEAMVHLFG